MVAPIFELDLDSGAVLRDRDYVPHFDVAGQALIVGFGDRQKVASIAIGRSVLISGHDLCRSSGTRQTVDGWVFIVTYDDGEAFAVLIA